MEGLRTAEYDSFSTAENFKLYNSTELPSGAPHPPHACDLAKPEKWFDAHAVKPEGGAWCFPDGETISSAMGQRWLLANFLAFNETRYMLEKYYAPDPPRTGA